MDDLISRKALLEELQKAYDMAHRIFQNQTSPESQECCKLQLRTLRGVIEDVKEAPTIEQLETKCNQLRSSYSQLSKALCGKGSATLEEILQAASQVKTRWVSVKEGLPEPFISVLCYMPGEAPHPTVREGFVNYDGEWYAGLYSRDADEVVMWRPVPLPPKEC